MPVYDYRYDFSCAKNTPKECLLGKYSEKKANEVA
jgi:hypothetical protein